MEQYEAVIGMEVHAELLTQSKMFCGCKNEFGGDPNTRCCPVCLALPGALPVANEGAIDLVMRAALALNCQITPDPHFDRKNYFYPDIPKGYQISQYDKPIGQNGWLDIEVDGRQLRVHIRRVHLEEDTGKLVHSPTGESLVDYNRAGVPLMEIVTEFPPDMHSAEEARAYLVALRSLLTYIGVTDGKMEEGSLRCEPNLSLRPVGTDGVGTKTEIKNLNSFRSVASGIAYEIARQSEVLKSGGQVVQETRGWSDEHQETFSQRAKEVEQEYRYFPDPDLVPLRIDGEAVESCRALMPELPLQALARFQEQYGLSLVDAGYMTQDRNIAQWFEEANRHCRDPKAVANWMMGDLARLLNADQIELGHSLITPEHLGSLVTLVHDGTISGKMAKSVFEECYRTGELPSSLAARLGPQISDSDAIDALLREIIAAEPLVWHAYIQGDDKKLGYFVGQVMKLSQGRANPGEVNRCIAARKQLG